MHIPVKLAASRQNSGALLDGLDLSRRVPATTSVAEKVAYPNSFQSSLSIYRSPTKTYSSISLGFLRTFDIHYGLDLRNTTPGRTSNWSTQLPLLLGEQPQGARKIATRKTTTTITTTMTKTMDLVDLPREMSLSTFLSPAGGDFNFDKIELVLMVGGKQLDSSYLILLALNEECRSIGRGAFYHLPLRGEEQEAHPCDLIYLPDNWSRRDTTSWDKSTWAERLEMCKIEGRIEANEDVLPICVRMLQFDTDLSNGYDSSHRTSSTYSTSPTLSSTDSITSTMPEHAVAKAPTSQFDPAIKPNAYRYSRPMEDISTLLIIYTSHHSIPSVCSTAAFEHDSLCKRSATPGDFSETFDYGPDIKGKSSPTSNGSDGAQTAQKKIAKMAAKRVMSSSMSSNRELVEHIWDIWHDDFNEKGSPEKDWLGRMTYSWQEVKSIIDGGGLGIPGLPYGWPLRE